MHDRYSLSSVLAALPVFFASSVDLIFRSICNLLFSSTSPGCRADSFPGIDTQLIRSLMGFQRNRCKVQKTTKSDESRRRKLAMVTVNDSHRWLSLTLLISIIHSFWLSTSQLSRVCLLSSFSRRPIG
ncbi:hypothetical protein B0H15DRAFT_376783 [Mycena belliarum]|uniref:Uncharacterized protein n=1 Tax=Mycena belliarum TaxID=1033014 RepID=A0AAD6U1A8_9AGAR|nr:hypothetical protein B0H15DRAFT_376783 [Mycena belliae]